MRLCGATVSHLRGLHAAPCVRRKNLETMPITPLHLGILAPVNHFFPKKVSNVSFILANLWMDGPSIQAAMFNLPIPDHSWHTHSLLSAALMGAVVMLLGFLVPAKGEGLTLTRSWTIGAFLGVFSHILLDGLVHSEMLPFFPWKGNPLYQGWMEPVSLALVPLTVWLIVQYVSGSLAIVRRRPAAARERSAGPSV